MFLNLVLHTLNKSNEKGKSLEALKFALQANKIAQQMVKFKNDKMYFSTAQVAYYQVQNDLSVHPRTEEVPVQQTNICVHKLNS